MKVFNRSLIILVLLSIYTNLIFSFPWPISEGIFANNNSLETLSLVFIISIGIGSLLAGLILKGLNSIWVIISGLFLAVVALGGYSISDVYSQLLVYRSIHGIAISMALTSVTYGFFVMANKEEFSKIIILVCRITLGFTILALPLKALVMHLYSFQSLILINIFISVFTATLLTIISKFYNFDVIKKPIETEISSNLPLDLLVNGFLGGIMASLTLGIFFYTFNSLNISQLPLSPGVIFNIFFFTMLVSLTKKITHISKDIGVAKAICSGLLLLALNISLLPILWESTFIILPIILTAIAFSIILSSSFYCLGNVSYKSSSLTLGLFYSLIFMGLATGYIIAVYNNGEAYSPLITNSIIIIGSSIILI